MVIQTYSEEYDRKQYKGKGGKFFHLGKQVEDLIGKILEQNKREGKSINSSILLIGRFNFDARNLCFSKDFVYDENNGKIFSKNTRVPSWNSLRHIVRRGWDMTMLSL